VQIFKHVNVRLLSGMLYSLFCVLISTSMLVSGLVTSMLVSGLVTSMFVSGFVQLSALAFPPSKWFGVKNRVFVEQRRSQLEVSEGGRHPSLIPTDTP